MRELVIAGDYLVTGEPGICALGELEDAVAARSGRRGAVRLSAAICHVRVGAESPQESRLRLLLIERGLPEPVINHEVRTVTGTFLARVDLAYPERRLAIEYEGDIHRLDLRVFRKDIARRERVEDHGWRMLRVTADDLQPAAQSRLIARVSRALAHPR
jgi:very-short-patch-repair endonuclease